MKFHWLLITLSIYVSNCDSHIPPNGLPRHVVLNYPKCNPTETCVDIRSCPTFIELLRTQGHHPQTTDELHKKNCGFGTELLKICCPSSSASHNSNQLDLAECGLPTRVDRAVIGYGTSLGDWPWVAALGSNSSKQALPSFHCAGALISKNWVLSAAHCVRSIDRNSSSFVRLGVLDLNNPVPNDVAPVDIAIDQIIPHPQYSTNPKIVNNIALFHLVKPVQYTKNIRRICLPSGAESRKNEYYFRRFPTILGWNIKNGQSNTWKLLESRDSLVEYKKCAEKYTVNGTTLINEHELCTKNLKKDHSQTDPGALLILPNTVDFRQYLEGIASYGFNYSSENPKVYTKVAQFIDWIRKTIQEKI